VGEIHRKAARGDLADAFGRLDACGADAELAGMARECLACEPEDRPRNAGVVTERLTAYLSGVQERLRTAELARVEAQGASRGRGQAADPGRRADAEGTGACGRGRAGGGAYRWDWPPRS